MYAHTHAVHSGSTSLQEDKSRRMLSLRAQPWNKRQYMAHVQHSAAFNFKSHGRYNLCHSNFPDNRIEDIIESDWDYLIHNKGLLDSPSYLREKGKAVVALDGEICPVYSLIRLTHLYSIF